MKKIQIIGLPGSGKSTAIQKFLSLTQADIHLLDVRSFVGPHRSRLFKRALQTSTQITIAESACGVLTPSLVIKLAPPLKTVYNRLLERDQQIDEDYLSLLSTQMVCADYTMRMSEGLVDLLIHIMEG